MITIGLVGGVASGKSVVACDFQKLGAGVLNGDRIGHEVLALPPIQDQLVTKWGNKILDEGGTLNRAAIAKLVFGEGKKATANLSFLESLTHPEIGRILSERIAKMRDLDRFPVCVIDAAVMMKAGWDRFCDHIVFVDAPVELRRKRAQLRGMSPEQFEARESKQIPIRQKKNRASIVIDNSGPPKNTFEQVKSAWQSLLPTNQQPPSNLVT